jgi:hypothetical protein
MRSAGMDSLLGAGSAPIANFDPQAGKFLLGISGGLKVTALDSAV